MIMTYNTWMSVKEACLKHVFDSGTGSDDTGKMFYLLVLVQMIPVKCFIYWYWFRRYQYYVFLYNGINRDA